MPCPSTNLAFPASPAFTPRPSCVSPNSRASAVVFRAPPRLLDTPGHHPSIPFNPHRARVRRRATSFKSLYRNRAGAPCPHIILLSMRASDTALGLLRTNPAVEPGLPPVSRPSGHNCARRRAVAPNVVLFREIAPHDSAPICRPLPWSLRSPASATSGPFDVGRVTGRPLDADTRYGIRQSFCSQQQPKA